MAPLRRRSILTAAAASVAAMGVPAQQRTRPVVALLSGGRQSDTFHVVEALVAELRALGHVDGQTFDARYADYSAAQGQRLAADPESGHVMSYGPERKAVWRRAAHYVDRIVKGARPSELPVELPTVFELVINRRSANAMNLVVPSQLLVLADRVID
jgi:hypothetical protein